MGLRLTRYSVQLLKQPMHFEGVEESAMDRLSDIDILMSLPERGHSVLIRRSGRQDTVSSVSVLFS